MTTLLLSSTRPAARGRPGTLPAATPEIGQTERPERLEDYLAELADELKQVRREPAELRGKTTER